MDRNPPPKKISFLVPSPPLRSKSRGLSVIISQKAMHRQLPSWLPPNAPFRVGETFCCPSWGTPDQIPGHSMHRKPFRRLTNLLGVSQETWAISWGIHVFTDGCMQSAVCVFFFLRDRTSSWGLCSLVFSVSCSDQWVSWLWERAMFVKQRMAEKMKPKMLSLSNGK